MRGHVPGRHHHLHPRRCEAQTGRCTHDSCLPAQIVLAVDRSASLSANSAWTWVKDEVLTAAGTYQNDNALGARVFPSNACGAGPLLVPRPRSATPSTASARVSWGKTTVARSSCSPTATRPARASRQKNASILLRSGVRTYPIAVGSSANTILLDQIAQAGGTGSARLGVQANLLRTTLSEVIREIGACRNARPKVGLAWYHGCAIRADGTLVCWGRMTDGRTSPPAGRFTAIAASTDASCAIERGGQISCWGRDLNGQLTPPMGGYTEIAGGDSHFCALKSDRTIVCWGNDADRQTSGTPPGRFLHVAATAFGACGLVEADQTVTCWGQGSGALAGRYRTIDGGSWGICGITLAGTIECSNVSPPPGIFEEVAVGYEHSRALDAQGAILCWGRDGQGQSSMIPPGRWVNVDVNYETTCAARDDDRLFCWGNDGNGQASPP